jgi:hypothetical protein
MRISNNSVAVMFFFQNLNMALLHKHNTYKYPSTSSYLETGERLYYWLSLFTT